MKSTNFIQLCLIGLLITHSISNASDAVKEELPNYISLYDKSEIKDAHELNLLMNSLPSQVYNCLDTNNKDPKECRCIDGPPCEYEGRFNQVVERYCAIKKKYPHWADSFPDYIIGADRGNFKLGDTATGYVLDMVTSEQRFGKTCGLE